jgi:hypothetical protein
VKKNKIFALVLMMVMLVSNLFPIVSFAASTVNVVIGTAAGSPGDSVTIPVSFQSITAGIKNCDFRLSFDSNVVELEEITPGIIIPNAVVNFSAYSGKSGVVSFLFSDSTQGLLPITINGPFANLKFKVKDNAASGNYTVKMDSIGSFSDSRGGKISSNFTSGSLTVKGDVKQTPVPTAVVTDGLKISVESVEAVAGQSVTVPINFYDVPETGINNCDFRLQYNSDIFDMESVISGSIIANSSTNFYSYAKSDGTVFFLFSDSTQGSNQIKNSGLFASIKLKVKDSTSAGNYQLISSKVGAISCISASDACKITPIDAFIVGGDIKVSKPKTTPTPSPSSVTPTATPVVTNAKVSIAIGNARGEAGNEISIPVTFDDVPKSGINNCDFKISYDSTVLQIKAVEAGSIIASSATDFVANYSKEGQISFLYSDSTQGSKPIASSGLFANIKAEIKSAAKAGTYDVKFSSVGAFSTKNVQTVKVTSSNGKVTVTSSKPTVTAAPTPTPTPTPTTAVKTLDIGIGSAQGEPGSVVSVPVNFSNVPERGVNNCDFRLSYNSSIMEIIDVEAGSIVPSPLTDFVANRSTGMVSFLYSDATQGFNPIVKDGTFANITLKIKENASAGVYQVKFSNVGSFSSKNMVKINVNAKEGALTVVKAQSTPTSIPSEIPATPTNTPTSTPTIVPELKVKVDIGNVTVEGQEATVPLSFSNVPENGINNCDFRLIFDGSALSVDSVDAGAIVTLPSVNFSSNYNSGNISFLFSDVTQGQNPIIKDGVFANIRFKVLNPNVAGNYQITLSSVGAFSSKNMIRVEPVFTNGKVTVIAIKQTPTPTSTSTPISTPKPTATPTSTVTPTNTPKPTVTPTATPVNPDQKVTVEIGNVKGEPGDTVEIPVSFKYVPQNGINNCDFKLLFNKDAIEIISIEAGSIVQLPIVNFSANKDDQGYLLFLYSDATQGSMQITSDGIFAVIKAKIKDTAVSGDYKLSLNSVGSFSSCKNNKIEQILPSFVEGKVTVEAEAATPTPVPTPVVDGFKVIVGDFSGKAGSTVTVPVKFEGVPEYGINNCDFRLSYDTSAMEVVSVDAGLITTLPIVNFAGYAGTLGAISFLFSDATQGAMPIKENGVFANITLKLKTDVSSDSNSIKLAKIGSFSGPESKTVKASVIIE